MKENTTKERQFKYSMNSTASQQGKRVYEAHFKIIFLTCWGVWILIMAASIIYMLIAGIDIVAEWQRSRDMILFMTAAVAAMSVLFPLFSWQKVEVDEVRQSIKLRSFWDIIFFRNRECALREIETLEKKRKPRRGEVFYLGIQDGRTYKINITNLKNGADLESYLSDMILKR